MNTIPFVDSYKQNKFAPADDNIDPKNKPFDKTLFLTKAQFLYSAYLRGDSMIPYMSAQEYMLYRLYGQGNQPNVKYMDICAPKNKMGKRKGFGNISWDNLAIYPKFRDKALSIIGKVDFGVSANVMDNDAHAERELMKYTVWVQQQNKEFLDLVQSILPPDPQGGQQPNLPFEPQSLQDLDMLQAMGSFKLAEELTYEKCVHRTMVESEYDEIQNKLDQDWVDLGIAATQTYTDPVNRRPMIRYVDPAYLICRQTRDNSFTHIPECAEIRFFSLKELEAYGLSPEDMEKAARAYTGMWNNPQFQPGFPYQQQRYSMLNIFQVGVLDMDFESFDTYKYEYRDVNGQVKPFRLPFNATGPSNPKNRYEVNRYARRYRCKWVIGTDVIFDYGYQYDQIFDIENKPKCSYNIYRSAERSLTSRCVSIIDDLQLCVLKLRNANAKARPSGIAIDWNALTNIAIGGEKMQPSDVLTVLRNDGDLLYRPYTVNGQPVIGAAPPIKELVGGIGPLFTELSAQFAMYVNQMREVMGIGQVVDGSIPQGDSPLVGTAEIAAATATDVMKPIINAKKRVKQRTASAVCLRWQLLAQTQPNGIDDKYINPNTSEMVILKLGWDQAMRPVEVICDTMIDDGVRQNIIQMAQQSLMAAKQGAVGITASDYFYIMRCVQNGQLLAAQTYLAYKEQQQYKQQQALQQQNMQMNAQNAQQLEQQKGQNAQVAMQATQAIEKQKLDTQIALENQRSFNKLQEIQAQGNEDRKTVALQAELKPEAAPSK